MKFSINQQSLSNVLSVVNKAIFKKSFAPSLNGVLIEAEENEVIFRTTNTEFSIQACLPALIEEDGKTLVNAKLLLNIVENFPDEAVSLESNKETLEIVCGKSNFELRVMNTVDFPDFPKVATTHKISLPFNVLSGMIKKVARISAKDDSRPVLQGINLIVKNNLIELVATDAYRIAITNNKIENKEGVEFEAVLPSFFMQDISSIKNEDDNVIVSLSENQVVVEFNDIVFVNRRIAGKFPPFGQLLNNNYKIKAKVNTKVLSDAVKRISVLDTINSVIKFIFDPTNNILLLSGNAQDIGFCDESFECEYLEGENEEKQEISFNCNYVKDGISNISSKNVIIQVNNDSNPGIFNDEDEDTYKYVLLPVKLR